MSLAQDELREAERRLAAEARYKLTGKYAEDARQLRRGRRMYWELNGGPLPGDERYEEEEDWEFPRRGSRRRRARDVRRTTTGFREEEDLFEQDEQVNLTRVATRLALERSDLQQKVAETRREFARVARRKLVLEEEWRKLQVDRANLEEDKRRFQDARRSPWFQSNLLPTEDLGRVRLMVGGQLFETTRRILNRDPGSLLAALVQPDSPIQADENGCYVIDRDWFLFRHVLGFLRDGTVPITSYNQELVPSLYKEAEFYNLETLRCAIREFLDPYQLVEKAASVPLSRLHKLEATIARTSGLPSPRRLVVGVEKQDEFDDGFEHKPRSPKKKTENEHKLDMEWFDKEYYKGRSFKLGQPDKDEKKPYWRYRSDALRYNQSRRENDPFFDELDHLEQPFSVKSTWGY